MVGNGEVDADTEGVGKGANVTVDELGVAAEGESGHWEFSSVGEVEGVVGGAEAGDAVVVFGAIWGAPVEGVLDARHAEAEQRSAEGAGGVEPVGVGEVFYVCHAGESGGEGERCRVAGAEEGE